MIAEIIAALVVGGIALGLVLEPLVRGVVRAGEAPIDELEPEDTPQGAALAALREIEFDRETGKLSETDYTALKDRYTRDAVQAMRDETSAPPPATAGGTAGPDAVEAVIAAKVRALRSAQLPSTPGAPACPTCGPRPEPDAVFCSTCGSRLPTGTACAGCGAALAPDGKFCEACGRKVAA